MPGRRVRQDTSFLLGLALPIFIFNALGATLVAGWTGSSQAPGFASGHRSRLSPARVQSDQVTADTLRHGDSSALADFPASLQFGG